MIIHQLQRLDDARSIAEVWAIHGELMASHGFDRLLYIATRFRTATSLGDLQDALCLTNHAAEYARLMIERGLIHHSTLLHRGGPGAYSWAMPLRPPALGGPARLTALAAAARAQHGLAAGYDLVFPEVSMRAGGAIELGARAGLAQGEVDAIWEARGVEIEILSRFAHRKIGQLPSWAGRRPLTPQQRRVLHWVSEGKTAQDIAIIMTLSTATIEKHLRLAREALDVETTAQAVAKAAHWNQLDEEERPRLAG